MSSVALDLLKAPAILFDKSTRKSAVDQEDEKPCWKSKSLLVISVSKSWLTTERRITEWYFLAVHLSPTFLNKPTTN